LLELKFEKENLVAFFENSKWTPERIQKVLSTKTVYEGETMFVGA